MKTTFILSLKSMVIAGIVCFLFMPQITHASPYTAIMNKACPDDWAITDEAIPVIESTLNPWGEPTGETDDKALAKTHLEISNPIITIDTNSASWPEGLADDLVNDLLTVASECLVYRNYEVDMEGYEAPTTPPNHETDWIPAAIL